MSAPLVPRPGASRPLPGAAVLGDGMVIAADEAAQPVAALLARELEAATGWQVQRQGPGGHGGHGDQGGHGDHGGHGDQGGRGDQGGHGVVRLRLQPDARVGEAKFPDPGAERYRLRADQEGVEIIGPSPAGLFYGTRTLRQLLPPALLRAAPVERRGEIALDGVEVHDGPRFGWRGVGLDVARHYFPKDFILKLVDLASLHKLNVLHLHLTDDQGWRVQSERYPRLTEVGAWRRESPLGHERDNRGDGTPNGGYYTKADLAEIVAYAAERFVTIVPEVDMPGHMRAAIAAYPELGNTGRQLEVSTHWGISEHVLNMAEPTVRFCTEVLEEIMDIFPGGYVHIGGDECPTSEWETSPAARQRCAELGLAGPERLQGWFTAQVAKAISARGRRLVGWDEVLDAGAPEGAVITVWRQHEARRAAIEGATKGHDIVMAPEPWAYFDWAYADSPAEPVAIRPAISVEKAYSFEPLPEGLPAEAEARVLGAQCQLWTEYVATPAHAEYMYFPRLCALAEVAWADRERDWGEFEGRLRHHSERLAALGVNYRPLDGPTPGQARTWAE